MATPPAAAAALEVVGWSAHRAWTQVVELRDGRIVVGYGRPGADPPLAVLGAAGAPRPFGGGRAVVSVGAMRLGADGALWVLDTGRTRPDLPPAPGGPKLLVLDAASGAVRHAWPIPASVLRPASLPAALAIGAGAAFVADAGAPALLVLDTRTGRWRRVLEGVAALSPRRPALVEGAILRDAAGVPAAVGADVLAPSADGAFLYMQAQPGPMYRVPAAALTDASIGADTADRQVEFWYNTPTLGGAALGPDGGLFMTDLGSDAVLRMSADRHVELVVRDARLRGAACPFVTAAGDVLVPVAPLDGRRAGPWPLFRVVRHKATLR